MNKVKYILQLILLVAITNYTIAQNTLEVRYIQSIKRHSSVTQPATLYYKDGKSIYVHSRGKKGNVIKNMDGSDWNQDLNTPFMTWYQDSIGVVFQKDYQKKIIQFREFFGSDAYLSQEDFPTIKWLVTKEQKKIMNYNCFKATTLFRGRNYTVWFTMEIPIQDGPWKFWGLPGLILEVKDDLNQVSFVAESLIYPSDKTINFDFPANGKKVDIATYRKLNDIYYEKSKRSYESKDYGRGVQISVTRKRYDGIEKSYE